MAVLPEVSPSTSVKVGHAPFRIWQRAFEGPTCGGYSHLDVWCRRVRVMGGLSSSKERGLLCVEKH